MDTAVPAVPSAITAESTINDVLARYPATAPVFTQGRRLYVDQPNDLYARFPGLTVGDFARQNDLDLGAVLVHLNALAESQVEARRPDSHATEDTRVGHFSLTLGYTASYRPREDAVPDRVSVVSVQSARGPE